MRKTLREASTVLVLARQAPSSTHIVDCNYKVLFIKRHKRSGFMARAHAFPGGVCEPSDSQRGRRLGSECKTRSLFDSVPLRSGEGEWLRHRVCAIRELFEETGLLLSQKDGGLACHTLGNPGEHDTLRKAVHDDASLFPSVIKDARLDISQTASMLHPWSRWITPVVEKRRFDTWFYVAPILSGIPTQSVSPDFKEVTRAVWMSPFIALAECKKGAISLPPPTAYVLNELCACGPRIEDVMNVLQSTSTNTKAPPSPSCISAGDVLKAQPRPMLPYLPTINLSQGSMCVSLPGDSGYDPQYLRDFDSELAGRTEAFYGQLSHHRLQPANISKWKQDMAEKSIKEVIVSTEWEVCARDKPRSKL